MNRNLFQKGRVTFFLYLYVAILLVAGLTPFRFNPKNGVHWTDDKSGVILDGDSIIYSETFSKVLYEKLSSARSFSLETTIESSDRSTPSLRFILACSAVGKQYNFALAQWRDHLIFFLKTSVLPKGGNIHIVEISKIFAEGGRQHVFITLENHIAKIFVNGSLVRHIEIPGTFSNWNTESRLFVGNDGSGEHPWKGRVYELAIYDRAFASEKLFSDNTRSTRGETLLYYQVRKTGLGHIVEDHGGLDSGTDLLIPNHFKVFRKTILSLPDKYFFLSLGFWQDVLINICGFTPLGFLLFLRFFLSEVSTARALWLSVLIGLIVSILIETAQILLPLRSSDSVDLLTNTVGSFVGACISMALMNRGQT